MVDILSKVSTKRKALAQAIIQVSSKSTIDAVINKTVPKGDVFEMAKAAGLLAVKKTSDVIPDCHPLPVEFTKISYTVNELTIYINVEVQTIYKTGVEVEAMYGASVTAITVYDMLKPIDKGISIEKICLLEKEGGKSDFKKDSGKGLKSGVIIVSDPISKGKKEDVGGKYILSVLEKFELENTVYEIIPDDQDLLKNKILQLSEKNDLVIISGGTGFSKKDKTPETLKEILHTEIPGIMEYARNYGQDRTPYAMFSRSMAGLINKTMVLAIPGSSNGAKETMDALFPYVLHGFNMIKH